MAGAMVACLVSACSSGRGSNRAPGDASADPPGHDVTVTADAHDVPDSRGPEDGGWTEPTDGEGAMDMSANADVVADLCNGVSALRLWILVEPNYSRELPGSQVRVENGSPFLVIDGRCSYWIGGGWIADTLARDRETRSGLLSPIDVETIEQAIPIDDVASVADCVTAGASDRSVRSIQTASGGARCQANGARFDAAWSLLEKLAASLWEKGDPMTGDIHIGAVAADDSSPGAPPPYSWPLSTPPTSYLLTPGKDGSNLYRGGISFLVDDDDSVGKLRAMRNQYLSDRGAAPARYISWNGLRVSDGTTTVFVYLRDAIPYEDAKGFVHF